MQYKNLSCISYSDTIQQATKENAYDFSDLGTSLNAFNFDNYAMRTS